MKRERVKSRKELGRLAEKIPATIAAAWGIRETLAKAPRQGLSLGRIVEAGLRVAVSDGIGALSMSRVASELGAATMSLYRHVSAKEELLAHMVDAAFQATPAAPEPREGWRVALARWAGAHLEILRRHPWLVRVPISGPPLMPNQVMWFERGLECLRDTGLAENEKPAVLLLVNGFVRNEATLATDLQVAAHVSGELLEHAGMSYGKLLSRLADAQRFPAIHALIASGAFEQPSDADADFEFGLERILDGIDALVRARRASASPATRDGSSQPARKKEPTSSARAAPRGAKKRAPRAR